MKKYRVTILLILSMILFVVGASAGIMTLIGAFAPSDAEVLELFSQVPERAGSSVVEDYTKRGEILSTFFEEGGSVAIQTKNMPQYDREYENVPEIYTKIKEIISQGVSELAAGMHVEDAERNLLREEENQGYKVRLKKETLNEIMDAVAEALGKEKTSALHIPLDGIVYLYANKSELTRMEAQITTNQGSYRFTLSFQGEKGASSLSLRMEGKIKETPYVVQYKKKDKESSTIYQFKVLKDKEKILNARFTEKITGDGLLRYQMEGTVSRQGKDKISIKAKGSIKDKKSGICVSFILDDVSVYDNSGLLFATKAQVRLAAGQLN